jgi:hypothetical protein
MATHTFERDYRIFFFKPGEKSTLWYSLYRVRLKGLAGEFEEFEVSASPWDRSRWNPESGIWNPESEIWNLESGILYYLENL